jgi:hypothetical protein
LTTLTSNAEATFIRSDTGYVYLAAAYISTPRVDAYPVILQMDRQPVLELVFIRIYNDDFTRTRHQRSGAFEVYSKHL